jgi:hypothetical protein
MPDNYDETAANGLDEPDGTALHTVTQALRAVVVDARERLTEPEFGVFASVLVEVAAAEMSRSRAWLERTSWSR